MILQVLLCKDTSVLLKRIQSLETLCPFVDPDVMISKHLGPELDVYSFGAMIEYLMSSDRDENSNIRMTPKHTRSSSRFRTESSFSFKKGSKLRRFSSSSGLFLLRGNNRSNRNWKNLNQLKLKCFRNSHDRPSISLIERRLFLILENECRGSNNTHVPAIKMRKKKFNNDLETKLDEDNNSDDGAACGGGGQGDVELIMRP